MKLIIILTAILISIFIFLFLINFNYKGAHLIFNKFENRAENVIGRFNKIRSDDDAKLFFEEEGRVNIFGMRVKSIEGLFLLRIISSLSFLIFFIIFGFLWKKNLIYYALIGAAIIYFLPSQIIKSKIITKSRKIQGELPDVIDILSSLIKAGLSLDEALNYISDNYKCEISKLFKKAQVKIFEGSSKTDAYYAVAKFSFCNDFRAVIKILMQAEIIGNPISKVLKDISRVIRNNQRDLLKISSERLESNLVLVIFIFMFIPTIFLFLLPVIPQLQMLF
jgi:Flp pilus assembly protein TadB